MGVPRYASCATILRLQAAAEKAADSEAAGEAVEQKPAADSSAVEVTEEKPAVDSSAVALEVDCELGEKAPPTAATPRTRVQWRERSA